MNSNYANNPLVPRTVLVVYASKEREHYRSSMSFYIEQREVSIRNGRFVMMAPKPMPENALEDIAKTYMKTKGAEMNFGGLIPEHILHCSNRDNRTVVVWYRPSINKVLNFSQHLGIKGDTLVNVPAILYVVVDRKLYLFALSSDDRPNGKTKLYHAPFFNVYDGGNVCLGTAPVGTSKAATFEKEAERFERGFYMAEQNGGDHNKCKTPLPALWREIIKHQSPFPSARELKQHSHYKTLDALLSKLVLNNRNHDDYEIEEEIPEEDNEAEITIEG